MGQDKFDEMIVEIERKTFEINMSIANFASKILRTFPEWKAQVDVKIVSEDFDWENNELFVKSVWLDGEDELIYLDSEKDHDPIIWDDLSLSTRDMLMNEIYGRYKSNLLYADLSSSHSSMH